MTLALAFALHAAAASPDPKGAEVVYVATGANFPDALGAGPAAALGNGPILLVQTESVPSQTTTELNRLRPRLIVIVGGTAVVSTNVENTLKGLSFGPTVIRVSGSNRYATAAAISAEAFPCAGGTVLSGYDRSGPICRPPLSGRWNLRTVDSGGLVGQYASLALDASGNPVIAYYDLSNGNLKLAHCNDPACSGDVESLTTVDPSANDLGQYASLALDSDGNPVISYYDATNSALKLAHCNDPKCSGGDESIQTVESAGIVGYFTSLMLDAAGNPVISYYDATNTALKLAHCNDANCAGGGESIQTVDGSGDVGLYTSLVLDVSGNPVISYYDLTSTSLKLAHCNDPNCADANESIQTVDSTGVVGRDTSLTLDRAGNPVIAYHDVTNTSLKLAHCNDPNCADANESIQVVASEGATLYRDTSLVLDPTGNPMIAYYDDAGGALRLVRCNDPNCSGSNETKRVVDTAGNVGNFASLRLDAAGNPVIAYWDFTNVDLKVASG